MPKPDLPDDENKPFDINDDVMTEEYDILDKVKEIQDQRLLYKYEELLVMHPDFARRHNFLFEKCVREQWSEKYMNDLIHVLHVRNQIKSNEIDHVNASKDISFHYAQKYEPRLLQKDGFKKK
jgi:hypothetical protein